MNTLTLHELWDQLVPQERRWLGMAVFFSLLGHLMFFFMFRVEDPAAMGLPARPAQVLLWDSAETGLKREEGGQLWLDWRDPSVLALPRSPLPELPAADVPGDWQGRAAAPMATLQPRLLKDAVPTLSEQMAAVIKEHRAEPTEVQMETPPSLSGTVVQMAGALSDRPVSKKSDLPQPAVDTLLKVSVLSLGVNAAGLVENVLVEESCGDPAVDELALREMRNWRFDPVSASGLQWGRAVVYWHFKEKTPAKP